MSEKSELEKKCIDTIRFLAADAIEKPGPVIRACLWARRGRLYIMDQAPEA